MPTLIRLVVTLAILAGLVFAAIFALATFVEPRQREKVIEIPTERLEQP